MLILVASSQGSERLGAGDDLDQLFRDVSLARAVVVDRQAIDDVTGVARGVVHGRHARALLAGRILQQRSEDLHRQIARQQLGEDLFLSRLEDVRGAGACRSPSRCGSLRCARGGLRRRKWNELLENNASFYGAQMSAMDNATRNAGDMIRKQTLIYNRTRQAMITKELIEIISGAEAL